MRKAAQGLFAIREGDGKLELGLGSGGLLDTEGKDHAFIGAGEGGPAGLLYNLDAGLREEYNVYQAYPVKVRALTALLEHYVQSGCSRP